jgi:ATP-binding cassette subfamily B protein
MDIPAGNEGSRGSALALLRTYLRALAFLRAERRMAIGLAAANVALALVQLAEPVLFGAVVDSIDIGGAVFELIGLWALLGLGGIAAGVVVSLQADRLANRWRAVAMADAFERVITLPISYHAQTGSGRLLRTLVAGTDALFLIWLGFFREHLAAAVGIVLLVPAALATDLRLAALLALLAALYVGVSLFVVRRTQAGQRAVERHHQDVFGHVGDVIGNVTVVQSYARPAAEASALQELMRRLLAAQFPVLTWWAMLTILTRASATVVMVVIFAAGAVLARAGEVSLGEIVSFIGFAGLLISRLDQITGFVGRLFIQAPTVDAFFGLLAAREDVREAPDARPLGRVEGRVAFEGVTYRFRARRRASSTSRSRPSPARRWPWSGRPAPARRRRWPSCSACATRTPAASRSTASTSARSASPRCGTRWPWCSRRPGCSTARSGTTS